MSLSSSRCIMAFSLFTLSCWCSSAHACAHSSRNCLLILFASHNISLYFSAAFFLFCRISFGVSCSVVSMVTMSAIFCLCVGIHCPTFCSFCLSPHYRRVALVWRTCIDNGVLLNFFAFLSALFTACDICLSFEIILLLKIKNF